MFLHTGSMVGRAIFEDSMGERLHRVERKLFGAFDDSDAPVMNASQ